MDNDSILDFIKKNERVTIKDIMEKCAISKPVAHNCVRELLEDGKIIEIGTSRGIYYTTSEMTEGQLNNLSIESKRITFKAQDDMKNVAEEVDSLKDQISKIYADFISLMSILVAVFSLVSVNANIIAAIANKCVCHIVITTVIVSVSVSLCMFIFILLIRWIVLKPIKQRNQSK